MKNEGNSIKKDFGFALHIFWLMFLFEMFNENNKPRWKVYNTRPPSKQELKKQKDEDDLYKYGFWIFFIYTLVDTVFSLF
jgi:hypothetical protein